MKKILIATFNDDDNIGIVVDVYCIAAPATFFEIIVLDSDSSSEIFSLTTGSGCLTETFIIANMISEGMLILNHRVPPGTK